jgi:hypothetical protein
MAKGKSPSPPKEAKAKQQHLEGMEPPTITEIEGKAEEYVEVRNERMSLLKKEVELQGELAELMKKHKLRNYEYDGQTVEVVNKEKVKVRRKKDDDDEEADEE